MHEREIRRQGAQKVQHHDKLNPIDA